MTEAVEPDRLRGIVEAVLMTADTPVTPGRLQALVKGVSGKDLRQAVDDLNERYRQGGHAMTITEVAGGFQVVTLKDFGPWVRKFHDRTQVRLTQAGLETLAIIAFKQPVTRVEVDSVRGVDSGSVLRTLMELNMIRIVGRSEGVGRPMLFGTTRDFMTHFGLRTLADLPRPKELEELLAEGERKARAKGLAVDEGSAPALPAADGDPVTESAIDGLAPTADAGVDPDAVAGTVADDAVTVGDDVDADVDILAGDLDAGDAAIADDDTPDDGTWNEEAADDGLEGAGGSDSDSDDGQDTQSASADR